MYVQKWPIFKVYVQKIKMYVQFGIHKKAKSNCTYILKSLMGNDLFYIIYVIKKGVFGLKIKMYVQKIEKILYF